MLANYKNLIGWLDIEYDKYYNLSELNQITLSILTKDGSQGKGNTIASEYSLQLTYMRRYITYFEDIARRIVSIILAFTVYEAKKEEYKSLKSLGSQDISPSIKRAKLLNYLKYTKFYLKYEVRLMDITIKNDVCYLNDRISSTIHNLQKLQA